MASGAEEGEINAYLGAKSDRKRFSDERYEGIHKKGRGEDPFAEYERLSRRYSPERHISRSPSRTRHVREYERRHHRRSPPPKSGREEKYRQERGRYDGQRRDDKRRDDRNKEERYRSEHNSESRHREDVNNERNSHQTKDSSHKKDER